MKSVCILVQAVYDSDIRVRRKAEALVGAGYGVDVLALRAVSQPRQAYSLNGVNVYTLSLGKRRGSVARYAFEYAAFFLWAFFRVTLQTLRRRYAVIDVNTLPDFLVFATVCARWLGAKVLLDMHEITPEFYVSKYRVARHSWVVRVLTFGEKISFRFADHVMTINEPIRDLLLGRGLPRTRASVITNSADESRFTSHTTSRAGADTAATSRPFVMMYHGTLTRIYGLDFAIAAFRLAHEDMPGAEFWILGDGPERSSLERQARDLGLTSKIKLVGHIAPDDIPAWLDKCDVGILPLHRDIFLEFAFPNKLAEYIITGKAVIIARLKAIRHYFSEEALAFFEPDDAADLARQMVRVYRDSRLRARLVAQARDEYRPIRWDVMKQRYLGLIGDLSRNAA